MNNFLGRQPGIYSANVSAVRINSRLTRCKNENEDKEEADEYDDEEDVRYGKQQQEELKEARTFYSLRALNVFCAVTGIKSLQNINFKWQVSRDSLGAKRNSACVVVKLWKKKNGTKWKSNGIMSIFPVCHLRLAFMLFETAAVARPKNHPSTLCGNRNRNPKQ